MHHGGYDQRMLSGLDGTAGGIDASGSSEERQAGILRAYTVDLGASEFYMEINGTESFEI